MMERHYYYHYFVELTKALAWPLGVLVILLLFRSQFIDIFKRSSGLKFEVAGLKFDLSIKEVHDVAHELFREVTEGVARLSQKQRDLFADVRNCDGSKTVDQLAHEMFGKPFVRGSDEHGYFRALRDAKLIRPVDGGRWQAHSRPIVTSYARTILRAAPELLAATKR